MAQLRLRELLGQLNLYVSEPEPVIICRLCKFTLRGTSKSISNYAVEKNNYLNHKTKQLRELLKPYSILGSGEFRLRSDHSLPYLHLQFILEMRVNIAATRRPASSLWVVIYLISVK
jgi:hypothetical protein